MATMNPETLTVEQLAKLVALAKDLASYPIEGDLDYTQDDENIYTDSESLYGYVGKARAALGYPEQLECPGLSAALVRVRHRQAGTTNRKGFYRWMAAESRLLVLVDKVKAGTIALPGAQPLTAKGA
jgi:hypothetical protein